jgi:membrane fusion protein (multidrug efflux system)
MRLRFAGWVALAALMPMAVAAQPAPGGPPAVGVVRVERKPIVESSEFVGRIQAIGRVDLVARVTAFLQEQLFTEGAEVKQGDLLYRLERAPFEADLQAKQATVAQQSALLNNANITLGRAQSLLNTPAGQRSTVDDAQAQQRSIAAQLSQAQAQLRTSQINLDYTEIRAPIDGKIGRTAVTVGNVVSPSSGALDTIVSQEPMYVAFPISVRSATDLATRYADKGGLNGMVVKVRLPDGSVYNQDGKLDFIAPSVVQNTDTLLMRAQIANPVRSGMQAGQPGARVLTDGEFVNVLVEGIEPVHLLVVPREAVLADQQGNYVFVVDAQNRAQQRRIQLGQSTPTQASVTSGLQEGEMVVTDGLQRVRPGQPVQPGPAAPGPTPPGSTGSGASAPGAAPPRASQPPGNQPGAPPPPPSRG